MRARFGRWASVQLAAVAGRSQPGGDCVEDLALVLESASDVLASSIFHQASHFMSEYALIGKRVRVHLYDRTGTAIGVLIGRVADVAKEVPVGKGHDGKEIRKDLAYVVDIETTDPDVPFRNSAGEENEGWFAVQDLQVIQDDLPSHISFN